MYDPLYAKMKSVTSLFVLVTAIIIVGCGSGESEPTETDRANLERLHQDGIGKVMADQAAKEGKTAPSLANPDGGPGPAGVGP